MCRRGITNDLNWKTSTARRQSQCLGIFHGMGIDAVATTQTNQTNQTNQTGGDSEKTQDMT